MASMVTDIIIIIDIFWSYIHAFILSAPKTAVEWCRLCAVITLREENCYVRVSITFIIIIIKENYWLPQYYIYISQFVF